MKALFAIGLTSSLVTSAFAGEATFLGASVGLRLAPCNVPGQLAAGATCYTPRLGDGRYTVLVTGGIPAGFDAPVAVFFPQSTYVENITIGTSNTPINVETALKAKFGIPKYDVSDKDSINDTWVLSDLQVVHYFAERDAKHSEISLAINEVSLNYRPEASDAYAPPPPDAAALAAQAQVQRAQAAYADEQATEQANQTDAAITGGLLGILAVVLTRGRTQPRGISAYQRDMQSQRTIYTPDSKIVVPATSDTP